MGIDLGNLGEAAVKIRADMASVDADLSRVRQKFSKSMDDIGSKMQRTGSSLTAKLTLPIVGIGAAAAVTFADFERGMNRVQAVTQATGHEFEGLKKLAMQLGATTQFTARDAADAMGFMAMAGMKANQIMGAAPSVLQLAASAQMDMARAADITTNVMAGFGLQVSDLPRANDVLVKSFISANTNLEQLGQAFKYAGPVAKNAGLSFEETSASLALMGNAGIQASMAGTSLRGAVTRLINPSDEAAELIKKLGIQVFDASGKMLPMADIIEQLEKKSVKAADMMELFGQRAGPAMMALVEQGSTAVRKLTLELENSEGIAQRVADTQMKGLKGAWIAMMSAAESAGITLGEVMSPALTKAANAGTKLFQAIKEKVVPAFTALPMPLQLSVGGMVAFAAAIGPVLLVAGTFVRAIGFMGTSLTALQAASFAFGNSIPVLTARLWLLEASTRAATAANWLFGPSMTALNAAALATTNSIKGAVTALGVYVASTNVGMGAALAFANAKRALAAVVLATSLNLQAVAARFGLLSAATSVGTVAAGAATGALGALKVALSAVATGVAIVAAAWAGWKIGSWIGEASGLTDAVGKLAAKVGEYIGLLPKGTAAEYEASRAAARAAEELKKKEKAETDAAAAVETHEQKVKRLRSELSGAALKGDLEALIAAFQGLKAEGNLSEETLKRVASAAVVLHSQGVKLPPELQKLAEKFGGLKKPANDAGDAIEGFKEKVEELTKKLSGSEAREAARAWQAALNAIGGVTKLTVEEKQELHDILQEVVNKYGSLKAAGLSTMQSIMDVTSRATKEALEFQKSLIGLSKVDVERIGLAALGGGGVFGGGAGMGIVSMLHGVDLDKLQKEFAAKQRFGTMTDREKHDFLSTVLINPFSGMPMVPTRAQMMAQPNQLPQELVMASRTDQMRHFMQMGASMPGGMGLGLLGDILFPGENKAPKLGDSLSKSLSSVMKGMPSTILAAFTGGGDVGKSIGGALAGGLFSEDVTKSITGKLTGALGGKIGGMLGSVVPGLGTLLGGLGGSLIGKMFGGLFGGKKKKEAKATGAARDKFIEDMGGLDELKKLAEAADFSLTKLLSTKKPEDFKKEVEKLNKALEEKKKKWEAIQTAIEGVNQRAVAFGGPFKTALTQLDEANKKANELRFKAPGGDAGKGVFGNTDELSSAERDALDKADAQWDEAKKNLTALRVTAQQEFEFIGMTATAAFAAAARESGSLAEAMKLLEPTFAVLEQGVTEFGLAATPAIENLLGMRAIVKENEAIFSSIDANQKMLKGFGEAGVLTKDLFQAIGSDIGLQWEKLKEKNVDANKAMALMQPTLQTLWEAQQKFGAVTDESTAALLKQAEEAGIVGAHQKSVMDKVLDVLLAIGDALGAKIPASLKQFEDAGVNAARNVEQTLSGISPKINIKWGSQGGSVKLPDGSEMDLPEFGVGGIVTQSMVARVGELGPEAIIPLDRLEVMLDHASNNDEQRMTREEIKRLRYEFGSLKSTLVTALRDALLQAG